MWETVWMVVVITLSATLADRCRFLKGHEVRQGIWFGIFAIIANLFHVNNHLCKHNDAQMFVTAWSGVFDPETGDLEYVSAGHNPPLVIRALQKFTKGIPQSDDITMLSMQIK